MLTAINEVQKLKFSLFGNKAPFSQGFAVKEIVGSIGGKLIRAGDVLGESGVPDGGTLIYIESIKGGRVAESIWWDNGVSVCCKYLNLGDGWQAKIDGNWVSVPGFSVELVKS